jgi:hypothetical protein
MPSARDVSGITPRPTPATLAAAAACTHMQKYSKVAKVISNSIEPLVKRPDVMTASSFARRV